MNLPYIENWNFFLVCFGVMLITSAIMSALARSFFTLGSSRKSFSMFDLEFPSSTVSTKHLLECIDQLGQESKKIKRALRAQLYVDFLFMPGTYLGVLFLCHQASEKAGGIGGPVFCVLAYLQLLCWLCDIMENIFLLIFIERPLAYNKFSFTAWNIMEAIKWGGSLIGFFSASFALLYFWITGDFHLQTVCSFFMLIIETILITLIMNRILRKKASPN